MLAVCKPFPNTNILNKRSLKTITDATECNQIGCLNQFSVSLHCKNQIQLKCSLQCLRQRISAHKGQGCLKCPVSLLVLEGRAIKWADEHNGEIRATSALVRRKSGEATRKELQEIRDCPTEALAGVGCFSFLWQLIKQSPHLMFLAMCRLRLFTPVMRRCISSGHIGS